METLGFDPHDHGACVDTAMAAADARCREAGLKLTVVRRRVLEVLLERHSAMGAYDILDILRKEGLGTQPPVAYRALDFLVKHGFVHRIERLNAFVACAHPDTPHDPAFLICRGCDHVAEATATEGGPLEDAAKGTGFEIERAVIEAEGLCPKCRKDSP